MNSHIMFSHVYEFSRVLLSYEGEHELLNQINKYILDNDFDITDANRFRKIMLLLENF